MRNASFLTLLLALTVHAKGEKYWIGGMELACESRAGPFLPDALYSSQSMQHYQQYRYVEKKKTHIIMKHPRITEYMVYAPSKESCEKLRNDLKEQTKDDL